MLKQMFSLMVTVVAALMVLSTPALADDWVNGYVRQDGTYVNGHWRSSANGTVTDNYSFYGNTNPYTGQVGSNRYYNSPSSPYYYGGNYRGYTSYPVYMPTYVPTYSTYPSIYSYPSYPTFRRYW